MPSNTTDLRLGATPWSNNARTIGSDQDDEIFTRGHFSIIRKIARIPAILAPCPRIASVNSPETIGTYNRDSTALCLLDRDLCRLPRNEVAYSIMTIEMRKARTGSCDLDIDLRLLARGFQLLYDTQCPRHARERMSSKLCIYQMICNNRCLLL
jgi:hypothetical protein